MTTNTEPVYRRPFLSHFARYVVLTILGILTVNLTACDISGIQDLGDDLELSIDVPPAPSTFSMQFVDAATEEPLAVPVHLTVTGPDADKIVDGLLYEPIESGEISQPLFTAGVPDGTTISAADPLNFTVVLRAEGYVSTSASFYLEEHQDLDRIIEFVSRSNPPQGTASTVDNSGSAGNDGTVDQEYTVSINAPGVGASSIKVPQGTRITDDNGQVLQGNLQTSVVQFSPTEEQSIESFPGGLNELNVQQEDGSDVSGSFISGGFLSVEITDPSGRQGTQFSQPLNISISVPDDMINPETGQEVQAGDQVPLWSYQPATGKWNYEGEVTLQGPQSDVAAKLGTSDLVASFTTRHLSYFNLDWFAPYPEQNCGYQQGGFRLNVTGNEANRPLRVKFVHPKYGWQYSRTLWWGDRQHIQFYNFPMSINGVAFTVRIYDYQTGDLISGAEVPLQCGGQASTSVNTSDLPFSGPVEIRANVDCGDRKAIVSYPIQYRRDLTGTYWRYGYMRRGVLRVMAEEGAPYIVRVSYWNDGEYQTASKRITLNGDVEDGVLIVTRNFDESDEGVSEVCDRF